MALGRSMGPKNISRERMLEILLVWKGGGMGRVRDVRAPGYHGCDCFTPLRCFFDYRRLLLIARSRLSCGELGISGRCAWDCARVTFCYSGYALVNVVVSVASSTCLMHSFSGKVNRARRDFAEVRGGLNVFRCLSHTRFILLHNPTLLLSQRAGLKASTRFFVD